MISAGKVVLILESQIHSFKYQYKITTLETWAMWQARTVDTQFLSRRVLSVGDM